MKAGGNMPDILPGERIFMYQLFCDSNCELWHTDVKEFGLEFIRMPYVLDGVEYYYDLGEQTDFKHFFDRMREGAVPTTSAINEQNYIDYFEPVLAAGKDIYYITFSHKMSATFQSMDRAIASLKEKYPDRVIRTFDTRSISLGAGSKSSSLLHDQKLVDNKTAATNSVTCLSRLFFICIVFLS